MKHIKGIFDDLTGDPYKIEQRMFKIQILVAGTAILMGILALIVGF